MLTWQDAERVFNIAVQLASNEVHHRGVWVELVHRGHEGMDAALACKSKLSSAQVSRLGLSCRMDSPSMCAADTLSARCNLRVKALMHRHGSSKGPSG